MVVLSYVIALPYELSSFFPFLAPISGLNLTEADVFSQNL